MVDLDIKDEFDRSIRLSLSCSLLVDEPHWVYQLSLDGSPTILKYKLGVNPVGTLDLKGSTLISATSSYYSSDKFSPFFAEINAELSKVGTSSWAFTLGQEAGPDIKIFVDSYAVHRFKEELKKATIICGVEPAS